MKFCANFCCALLVCFSTHKTSGLTPDQSDDDSKDQLETTNNHVLSAIYQVREQVNNVFEKMDNLESKIDRLEQEVKELRTTCIDKRTSDVDAEVFISRRKRKECNGACSVGSRNLQNSVTYVPVLKINGTHLYTGLYYRMGMKTFPQGWITWVNKGKYYIEVELAPSELPRYETGRDYQFENQWTFGPTESSIGYTMTNRGKPNGYLIWASAKVRSGHHVAVYDEPDARSKMSPGGAWRNDALWIVKGTNENNYYKLENFARRSKFLTWTTVKHNNFNYYIQMANDMGDDSKFSFAQSSNIKLEAKVFDFKFNQSLELGDILGREENQDSQLISKNRLPNPNSYEIFSTVKEYVEMKDQFRISLTDSWAMMHKTTVYLDSLVGCGSQEFSFQGGFEASEEKSTEIQHTVTLRKEIQIPSHTNIEVSIYAIMARDVEIPFTAKMEINGLAERVLANLPNETKESLVPAEIVEDVLNSSGKRNMEIISRSNETLIISVSGTIKGNFGLKGILKTGKVGGELPREL